MCVLFHNIFLIIKKYANGILDYLLLELVRAFKVPHIFEGPEEHVVTICNTVHFFLVLLLTCSYFLNQLLGPSLISRFDSVQSGIQVYFEELLWTCVRQFSRYR